MVQDFSHQQYEVYNIFKALSGGGGALGGGTFWCTWELISKINDWDDLTRVIQVSWDEMDEDVPKNHEQKHHCLKKFRNIFPCKVFPPKKKTSWKQSPPKKMAIGFNKSGSLANLWNHLLYFIPSAPLNLVEMTGCNSLKVKPLAGDLSFA